MLRRQFAATAAVFSETHRLVQPIAERSVGLLLTTMLGCEMLHQYFTSILQIIGSRSSTMQVPAILGDILVSLLEFVVLTMLIPMRTLEVQGQKPAGSFLQFTAIHLKALSLESVRALAMCLLWLLALIIPGLVKYVRYFFVPYIVVADPEYQAGRIDALKESDRLVRGISWPLFFVILILSVLEFWQQGLREKHLFFSSPFLSLFETIGFFALNYYTNIWLFVLYQHRAKTLPRKESTT
jgi:hypothetical protein